ncbi:MAG: hypothetical protein IKK37_00460 [Clostridia bacterium]|nr:hypothetical protein [Clostridia bacterium]
MKLAVKRFLSVIMSVIILVGIMQINVFAASSDTVYDLYLAGVQITEQNRNDVLGDGGSVKFDSYTDKLTLTNANITEAVYKSGYYSGIHAYGTITIELIGENVIDLRNIDFNVEDILAIDHKESAMVNGIYIDFSGKVNIVGNGSLSIATPDSVSKSIGINAYHGSVCLKGGCSVEIETGGSFESTGIQAGTDQSRFGHIEVTEGSTLNIKTGNYYASAPSRAVVFGIDCDEFYVRDNSTVYIETGDTIVDENVTKMWFDCNSAVRCRHMYVVDNSSVTAIAGKSGGFDIPSYEYPNNGSIGITGAISNIDFDVHLDIEIFDSTVIASGYDQAFSSLSAIKDSEIYSGIEFYCSDNVDGSYLKKIEVTSTGKDIEKPYVMIVPEGSYEPPEKSFFEKIADFFRNLFERIAQFFDYIF